MLWLKSQSAEAWLDRRTNYSQSLSVMSMAGYILGLGDRHMRYVCVVCTHVKYQYSARHVIMCGTVDVNMAGRQAT